MHDLDGRLAGARGPARLSDPEVIEDHGVTHLRYAVRKQSPSAL